MKRVRDEDEDDDEALRRLVNGDDDDGGDGGAEQVDFDESSAKKLLVAFERASSKNQEARGQFSDPSKWVESEVALDEALSSLHVMGSCPTMFPLVVQMECHKSLIELMSHNNIDMSTAVLTLLTEWLEGSDEPKEMPFVEALAGELAVAGAIEATLANWERLDVTSEGAAVYQSMQFLERMLEHDPESAETLMKHPKFLRLVSKALAPSTSEYGDPEVAVSEVLSTAALAGGRALESCSSDDLDGLLVVLHKKGRTVPDSSLLVEVVSNVCDALANLALSDVCRAALEKCSAAQLMVRLIHAKGSGMVGAMRLLAVLAQDSKATCEVLIEDGALKDLSKWLSKEGFSKSLAKRCSWGQDEWKTFQENVIAILYSCCTNLGYGTIAQLRLWKRFDDDGGKLIRRAAQLWGSYRTALAQHGLMVSGEPEDEDEEITMKRLENGLVPLIHLSMIVVMLVLIPSPLQQSLMQHIREASALNRITLPQVAALVKDEVADLSDLKDVLLPK